jgi:hypothetical protein
MMLINYPHKIFENIAAAEKAIHVMGFEDGETRISIDPQGSGRCFVEVLDLEDGAVIGRI